MTEFLRYETPTLFVARIPIEAATVAGVAIGALEPVLVYLAAANRDPAAYANPDEFLPGRELHVNVIQIAGAAVPEVLPLAEIEFHDTRPGWWPVYTFTAKWDMESDEYKNAQKACLSNG